jgi:cytokinin dehydrogenase
MSDRAEAANRIAREAGVAVYADAPSRATAERDFGGIVRGSCLLVAEPSTPAECERLVGALAVEGIGCTIRGAGYGQGGQSIASDSVSLSTRRLDRIAVDRTARKAVVGSGASLRRVLRALGGELTPPVLPLNLDMSIGGLLSAGGLGALSHRHGPVAAHVSKLDVVTGSGRLLECSPDENRDLFNGVLAGIGQSGLITEATLELEPAPKRMRVTTFLYDDRRRWLADQIAASDLGADVGLEGYFWAAAKGLRATPAGPVPFTEWMYGLHVAVDAEAASTQRDLEALLRPSRTVDEHETDRATYDHRYAPRFSGMVESGAWTEPHPWFEALLPLEGLDDVLDRALRLLPAELGDGHRLMLVNTQRAPANFIHPAGPRCVFFGLLPVAVPRGALPKVLAALDALSALVLEVGGRRYLSGWLGSDPATYLRAHFAERYDEWRATRRKHDPQGIWRSALFADGNRS